MTLSLGSSLSVLCGLCATGDECGSCSEKAIHQIRRQNSSSQCRERVGKSPVFIWNVTFALYCLLGRSFHFSFPYIDDRRKCENISLIASQISIVDARKFLSIDGLEFGEREGEGEKRNTKSEKTIQSLPSAIEKKPSEVGKERE